MADDKTPEAGERCRVTTSGGEEVAIWTGLMWASEDGSRIIDAGDIESWKASPLGDGDFKVAGQTEG